MRNEAKKPRALRVLPDLVAFGIGLSLAWYLEWETVDLVWSLWLGSLLLGYLTLLLGIAGPAYVGWHLVRVPGMTVGQRAGLTAVGLVAGLFVLGFFSLHFGGFHAGHAVFLNTFFPLPETSSGDFAKAFTNPPLLLALAFRHLVASYGLFLIPAIVVEREHLLRPLLKGMEQVREMKAGKPNPSEPTGGATRSATNIGGFMGRPYLNVMRMHLLIFFFAAVHLLQIDSFLTYAVVYATYFFPWRELKRDKPQRTEAGAATTPQKSAT